VHHTHAQSDFILQIQMHVEFKRFVGSRNKKKSGKEFPFEIKSFRVRLCRALSSKTKLIIIDLRFHLDPLHFFPIKQTMNDLFSDRLKERS
jgi:hypothetical protein